MKPARDLMVGEVILQQLTSAGCKVIATDSGTDLSADSDDPIRRLIRQVLGAEAEFDPRVTVTKLRAARERCRARGERCEGRKPLGTLPGPGCCSSWSAPLGRCSPKCHWPAYPFPRNVLVRLQGVSRASDGVAC